MTDAGEDIIYVDEEKKVAVNKEVYTDEVLENLGLSKDSLVEKKAVEVGNIFTLGTRFSDAIELFYTDEEGNKQPVFMGSYGIGPARLMGTVVEVLSDEKGIIWPEAIAPFKVHLVSLGSNEEAEKVYKALEASGVEVLFDDREGIMAGEKFADADLLGIPYRVVVSERSLGQGGYELKERAGSESSIVELSVLLSKFA